ncbi:hypothetical protein [Xylanibacter rarus]|uniref:hypothetical protein n=1 Tax=Xylanibacter rarus TaxID=1676614 RepID=UPI00266B9D21
MIQFNPIVSEIQEKMKNISFILMQHENKDFCLAKVHTNNWRQLSYRDNHKEYRFIIVSSPVFARLILQREYLKIVDRFPEYFGTENDWNIIRAIKEYDKNFLLREYSDREFFDYIRGETMAYVFKIENNETISNRILRLDLCRNINSSNVFQGGIFHVFKHFTPKGYNTISSNHKEFIVETFSEIYRHIILNFYSDEFVKEEGNCYEAKSLLRDGHVLRGIYYKEDEIPVSFINSMRID